MTGERVSATTTIHASAEAVFAVLADPAQHASIDSTGWVTEIELTYDWSAVGPETREYLEFPPFPPDHLENSLTHLAELVRGDAPHT
jgi:hypothetical protein